MLRLLLPLLQENSLEHSNTLKPKPKASCSQQWHCSVNVSLSSSHSVCVPLLLSECIPGFYGSNCLEAPKGSWSPGGFKASLTFTLCDTGFTTAGPASVSADNCTREWRVCAHQSASSAHTRVHTGCNPWVECVVL